MLNIVVVGAAGRMGRTNVAAVADDPALNLSGALEHAGSDFLGQDVGPLAGLPALDVAISDNIDTALEGADAIIDFSTPATSVALAQKAAEQGLVHIIGTTGCTKDDEKQFAQAAENGARIVKSGNFSMGIVLLTTLVKRAAQALDADFDVEVLEMHHKRKVDAPSGTALMLGQAAADGREIDHDSHATLSREGITGARKGGTIGYATLRGGDVIGDHSVMFVSESERLELTHKAQNRSLFSAGALRAAKWAADKPKGLYSMLDVLNLNA